MVGRTVNRFFETPPADGGPNVVFEGPGRDNKAFPPPTFRVPSLIALEEEVNGSGAATLESFWFGETVGIGQRLFPVMVVGGGERGARTCVCVCVCVCLPFRIFCRPWFGIG